MSLNGIQITDAMQGLMAPQDATGITNTNARFGVAHYKHSQIAFAAAGVTFETPIDQVNSNLNAGINVTNAKYLPSAPLTAASTNYCTLTLEQATPAGVVTVIGSAKTQPAGTGNWTAQVPVPLTITSLSAYVPAGNTLIFKMAQNVSGVAVPQGSFIVDGVYV